MTDLPGVLLSVAHLHWVVMVTPGANVLIVSSLAAAGSRSSACFAAAGISAVAGMWAALAVFGVDAAFSAHPYLRPGLQLAGGIYLLVVALRLWRSGVPVARDAHAGLKPLAAFRLGLLTNFMNSKTAAFSDPAAQSVYARKSRALSRMAGLLVGVIGAKLMAGVLFA